jgi:hypothetical protein
MDDDELIDEDDTLFVSFKTSLRAIRVIDRELQAVKMNLRMDFADQETDDSQAVFRSQVAMAKIRYWLDNCVEDCVMFNRENDWAMGALLSVDEVSDGVTNRVMILPDDPGEDILLQIFQSKLQSLAGTSMRIGVLELDIEDGNGFHFTYVGEGEMDLPTNEEWVGEIAYFKKPWWARDDASMMDIMATEETDLHTLPKFAYSLDFIADALRPEDAPSAHVVRLDFRPRVIQGGITG